MRKKEKSYYRVRSWSYDETPADMWAEHRHIVKENGTVRWISNGALVPTDIVEAWANLGYPVDPILQHEARTTEIAEMRRQLGARPISNEERMEARAAYGPGVEIVCVISGRRFTT